LKASTLFKFSAFGLSTIVFRRKDPILGTIILTDKCNLTCKHCAVNNLTAVIYPYRQIKEEMRLLYDKGVRILFFCGGEPFLWASEGKSLQDLVIEAKSMGFLIVIVVSNGTFPLDIPEADLLLISLDGQKSNHDLIRGETYDTILGNIRRATSDNICLYMAVNQLNKGDTEHICRLAAAEKNIRAASFNFHTPYPGTENLSLTLADKQACCKTLSNLLDQGLPIFNLKSTFPYLLRNKFPRPCHQCLVMENSKISVCGRCIEIPGLCDQCGYFFAAEYALVFSGNIKVIFDMLHTYLRYI